MKNSRATVIVLAHGEYPSVKRRRYGCSTPQSACDTESPRGRFSAGERQQTSLRSDADRHRECARGTSPAGFEGIHRTIAYASALRNWRGSVVSSGVSQPSSVREARSGSRIYEAFPRILAHLLSST